MSLPPGLGAPSPDGADVLAAAAKFCDTITSVTTEIGVTGSAGGRRLRARLLAGLAAPASARLEAFAFGQPVFILAARDGAATVLLTREGRVLERAEPAAVLEALTGVSLDAAELRRTLTGCPAGADGSSARAFGRDWRQLRQGDDFLYFRRESIDAPWRLTAIIRRPGGRREWRTEYREFERGLPRTIRLRSTDASEFDLRLALSQVAVNEPLTPAAFEIRVPPGTAAITLDELRESGPLNAR
jgi:hypothetical protein